MPLQSHGWNENRENQFAIPTHPTHKATHPPAIAKRKRPASLLVLKHSLRASDTHNFRLANGGMFPLRTSRSAAWCTFLRVVISLEALGVSYPYTGTAAAVVLAWPKNAELQVLLSPLTSLTAFRDRINVFKNVPCSMFHISQRNQETAV